MFGRDKSQQNPSVDGDEQKRVSPAVKLALCVSAIGAYIPVAQQAVGVDAFDGVSTLKEVENNVGGALRCIVGIMRLEAQLSATPHEDLLRDGKEHIVAQELSSLVEDLKSHFGRGYLEYPLAPHEEVSSERRLYAACVGMHEALEQKDAGQIERARAELAQAIVLHKG